MNIVPIRKNRLWLAKRVLGVLRVTLAVLFLALGCGFLVSPELAEDLDRAGIGPIIRMVLGASHILGGLALMVPRLARETAFALGLLVAFSTIFFHAEGVDIRAAGPASLVFVLLIFGIWWQFHQRVDATVWREMLGRYADQQDSLRSENA